MKKILLFAALFSQIVFAGQYQFPVPKDISNTPIYGGLGTPAYSASVAVTSTSFVDVLTVPLTGQDDGRQYRHICVWNPSSSNAVRVCFGSGCSTVQMSIPAATSGAGVCLDHIYFGALNNISVVRASLDGAGSVNPQITIW